MFIEWSVMVLKDDEIIRTEQFVDEFAAKKRISQLQHEYHVDVNEHFSGQDDSAMPRTAVLLTRSYN
jgi:hypothetical protein